MDDPDEWGSLLIDKGCIVEAPVEPHDEKEEPIWGGFLVMGARITHDASLRLHVKSLGCGDPQVARELSSAFNRKEGHIHLCPSSLCMDYGDEDFHVKRIRVYSAEGFAREYMTAHTRNQIKKWLGDLGMSTGEPEEEETEKRPPAPGPKRAPALRSAPPKVKGRRAGKPPGAPHKESEVPGAGAEPSATEEAKRAMLRERLRKAKESMAHGLVAESPGRAATRERGEPGSPVVQDVESSSEGYSASIAEDGPSTGTCLTGKELDQGATQVTFADRPKVIPKAKKKKKKRGGVRSLETATGVMAISDGTTTTLQTQLMRRAAERSQIQISRKKQEESRLSKKDAGSQLLKILTKLAKGQKDRKEKKDKKSRKRRRRVKLEEGGDPSDSSGSSPTPSGGGD